MDIPQLPAWAAELSGGGQERWQRGRLLIRRLSARPGEPRVAVFDREGALLMESVFDLPDVRVLSLFDAAVGPRSEVICAAVDVGGLPYTGWIVRLDANGRVSSAFSTGRFLPRRIDVADDGLIWIVGGVLGKDSPESTEPILRAFDGSGALRASGLPRSLFPGDEPPCTPRNNGDDCVLRVASRRVVVALPGAERVVEMDWAGNLLGQWPSTGPDVVLTTGRKNGKRAALDSLAVSPDGSIYGSFTGGVLGGIHRLDRTSGRWSPITGDSDQGLTWRDRLLGLESNQIVVHKLFQESAHVIRFLAPQ